MGCNGAQCQLFIAMLNDEYNDTIHGFIAVVSDDRYKIVVVSVCNIVDYVPICGSVRWLRGHIQLGERREEQNGCIQT